MRVAIYARVSTRDKGQDPENQVHQLRAFAEQHGTIYKVYTEEVSGGKSDRSEFKLLLLEAYQKKFDLVVDATPYRELTGYSRPVKEMTITYSNSTTGEVVATARAYAAGGGWLVQKKVIALTSTSGPLLGRDECFPPATERARLRQITSKLVN